MLCAEMVSKGARIADVGTDHAYLPVWLVRAGIVPFAIATDIKAEPLKFGEITVKKYRAENSVQTRLCDGLRGVASDEIDQVVIAGMGGETIVHILREAPWLKSRDKKLILQPMSKHELVIAYLYENGFKLDEHRCTIDEGKVYTAFSAVYTGEVSSPEELFCYTGLLTTEDESNRRFLTSIQHHLEKKSNADPHFGTLAKIIGKKFLL